MAGALLYVVHFPKQRGVFTKPLPVISVTQRNKAPLFGTCHSCHALFRMNCTDGRLESPSSSESGRKCYCSGPGARGSPIRCCPVTAQAQRALPPSHCQLITLFFPIVPCHKNVACSPFRLALSCQVVADIRQHVNQ